MLIAYLLFFLFENIGFGIVAKFSGRCAMKWNDCVLESLA
jgi:hypothetical protein